MAQRKNSGRTYERAGNENRNASATKRGPGRYHTSGLTKAGANHPAGALEGFVLHTASAEKKERKALIALHGRRQFLRLQKEFRAEHKAANDERTDALSTRHYESLESA